MGYIVIGVVSFLFGYTLWFKHDNVKGKPITFNEGIYVASKKRLSHERQSTSKTRLGILMCLAVNISKFKWTGLTRKDVLATDGIMIKLKGLIKK